MRLSSSLLVLASLVASSSLYAAACGGGTVTGLDEPDASTGSSSGATSSGDVGDASTPGLPSLASLPANKFTFVKTGGATTCALGSEYGFAVRPGDPTKVVIEFEGGGACFNDLTCSHPYTKDPDNATFKDFATAETYEVGTQVGLRNHDNAANPIKGWTHVVVPYCSGDVHWGDTQTTYHDVTTKADIVVQHRGATNTEAVLQYVYSQISSPEHVFVTGCSAGGYGSIWHAASLRAHYTKAKFRQFSDSAAGVFPGDYFNTLVTTWGLTSKFPTNIGAAADFTKLSYLYQGMSKTYPDVTLSQYNVVADTTQALFLSLMRGSNWAAGMLANVGEIEDTVPQFRDYLSPGSTHCIIEKDELYTKEVAGTKLTDWLGKIVADESVDDVHCPSCTTTHADAGTP